MNGTIHNKALRRDGSNTISTHDSKLVMKAAHGTIGYPGVR